MRQELQPCSLGIVQDQLHSCCCPTTLKYEVWYICCSEEGGPLQLWCRDIAECAAVAHLAGNTVSSPRSLTSCSCASSSSRCSKVTQASSLLLSKSRCLRSYASAFQPAASADMHNCSKQANTDIAVLAATAGQEADYCKVMHTLKHGEVL